MDLLEEHLLVRPLLGPPVPKSALQRAQLAGAEAARKRSSSTPSSVMPSSTPRSSAANSGTTSCSQTPANGSIRVRQARGFFVCDGSGPLCHCRPVRTLIPAAALAASCVLPSISFCLSKRTCASVTIAAPGPLDKRQKQGNSAWSHAQSGRP
jgi:hypothetical protein